MESENFELASSDCRTASTALQQGKAFLQPTSFTVEALASYFAEPAKSKPPTLVEIDCYIMSNFNTYQELGWFGIEEDLKMRGYLMTEEQVKRRVRELGQDIMRWEFAKFRSTWTKDT